MSFYDVLHSWWPWKWKCDETCECFWIWNFKIKQKGKTNVYEHFSTMVENNTTMLQQFAKINVLFKNMDVQIRHVIDKL